MSGDDDAPKNRMGKRLQSTGEESGPTPPGGGGGPDQNAGNDSRDQNAGSAGSAWRVDSVKQAWTGVTVHLPDHIREEFDDEYRRVDFELSGETPTGDSLKKDRHFKPLVISLGLEVMAGMDDEELNARMERMMREELLSE